MRHWFSRLAFIVLCTVVFPFNSPAPLIYRADEGWTSESVGGGKWRRTRAKDQLEVAQSAFEKKDYSTAVKAAQRTVKTWPLSDYAPKAVSARPLLRGEEARPTRVLEYQSC
jgi:hypothetical protein